MSQNLKPNRSDNRGGSRIGAGRKPLGNVTYSRKVPPEFVAKLDKYLNGLKTENQKQKWSTTEK